MKQWIQAFSIGLLTSTAVLGITYLNTESPEAEVIKESMSEQDMMDQLEQSGYRVLSNEEWAAVNTESPSPQKSDPPSSQGTTYSIDITEGTATPEIAEKLVDAGIIEDADAFTSFMEERDYSRYIQIGQATVTSSMTLQEIAEAVTSK